MSRGCNTTLFQGYLIEKYIKIIEFYNKIGLKDIFDKIPNRIFRLGEFVGEIRKEIADLTGLYEGTPVGQGAFDGASEQSVQMQFIQAKFF